MIKNLLVSTVALATLSTAAVAGNDFGLAFGVSNISPVIKADIVLDEGMRIEPFFSFGYSSITGIGSNFSIGTAFHVTDELSKNMNVYYGGYVGIAYANSNTNFTLGPVAGLEYYFDKQFSLAGEVNFDLGFGNTTNFGTNTQLIARYYFDAE